MSQWIALVDAGGSESDPQFVGPFPNEETAIDWLKEFGYWDDDEVWSAAYELDPP